MIKGPKNAVPTLRGWAHAKTGEILKSGKISQDQIDEWYGVEEPAPKVEEVVDVVYSTPVVEEPEPEVIDYSIDYEAMTRSELLELAEASGITVSGFRPSKAKIIESLKEAE